MKSNIIPLMAFLFLSAGQISCSSDKADPRTGSEKLEAPILKGQDQEVSLKVINSTEGRNWTLSDQLEFANTLSFQSLEVTSNCIWNDQELIAQKTLKMEKSFQIHQLVSDQLLHVDFQDHFAECRISFVAQSSKGSRHSFDIHKLMVGKSATNQLNLTFPAGDFVEFSTEQIWPSIYYLGFKIQTDSQADSPVALICQDFQLVSKFTLREIRTLNDFDYSELHQNPEILEKVLRRPVQICVVATINREAQVELTSQPLHLRMIQETMQPKVSVASKFSWSELKMPNLRLVHEDLYRNQIGMQVITLSVSNPTEEIQEISVPEQIGQKSFSAVLPPKGNSGFIQIQPPVQVLPIVGAALVLRGGSGGKIQIPPKSTVEFSYNFLMNLKKASGFPFLIQADELEIKVQHSQIDGLNGKKENNYRVNTDQSVINIPKNIFISEFDESKTRDLFKDYIKP